MAHKDFRVESPVGGSADGSVTANNSAGDASSGDAGGIAGLIAAWTKKEREAGEFEAQAWLGVVERVERTQREVSQLLSSVAKLGAGLELLHEQMEAAGQRLESLESALKKLSQQLEGLSPAVGAFEKNLEQVRLLTERTVARVDRLSSEFIERQVREPLLKEVGDVYNEMRRTVNDGDGMAFVMDRTRKLMECEGVRVVEPKKGASFDPREHEAIESVATSRKKLDRRVAIVHRVGFRMNGRVIQQALVGLYFFQGSSPSENEEEKGEQI